MCLCVNVRVSVLIHVHMPVCNVDSGVTGSFAGTADETVPTILVDNSRATHAHLQVP